MRCEQIGGQSTAGKLQLFAIEFHEIVGQFFSHALGHFDSVGR